MNCFYSVQDIRSSAPPVAYFRDQDDAAEFGQRKFGEHALVLPDYDAAKGIEAATGRSINGTPRDSGWLKGGW